MSLMDENKRNPGTEVQAVVDALEHLEPVKAVEIGVDAHGVAREVLAVRAGYAFHDIKPLLDKYRLYPERRKGTAELDDLPSFISHTKRFADADSVIFADREGPALRAVLNYHRHGADGQPQFGDHSALYEFPLSDEWTTWTSRNGKPMTQADFAAFIESRLADLDGGAPGPSATAFAERVACEYASPSRLIALSRGLTVREDSRVVNAQNLSTGETQLVFETSHTTTDKDGGPLTVPGAFLIAIPVFRRGAPYQIAVRLRYRKADAKIVWYFEMHRHDVVFDHAFDEACAGALQGTGLPLFLGRAEQ